MSDSPWRGRLIVAAKWGIALAIMAAVAWVFVRVLGDLDRYEIAWNPAWLIAGGLLYVLGAGFSVAYWWWAMRSLGQRPGWFTVIRAYYIGHLGKYIPGKAMVIIIRTALVRGPEVRTAVAALTVAYEALTSMAAGALLGAILMALRQLESHDTQLWHVLVLLLVAVALALPKVFNPLVNRIVAPFRAADAAPLPRFRTSTLLGGLVLGGISWFWLGASLWTVVKAVHPGSFGPEKLLDCTAYLSIATVAGFFTPAPGGLGAREWVLMKLLAPELGEAPAALVALLLRLTWITSEVVFAAILYPLPWMIGHASAKRG